MLEKKDAKTSEGSGFRGEELRRVGNTPMIALKDLAGRSAEILAKLEWHNPFGSLKDRAAYWMIREAERKGELSSGKKVIIEPTSGNTGIALAGIASARGYEVEVLVPDKVSQETKEILRAAGAAVEETHDDMCPNVGGGTDQSIALAKALVAEKPERYFMPNQYENEANYLAHYHTTGPEILRETSRGITHFVAGVGTGGTITGVAEYLKERKPGVKIVAVEPQGNHHIQGLRNLRESMTPEVLERRIKLIDKWVRVSDEEAFLAVRQLALKDELFVGPSSGAVVAAVSRLSEGGKERVTVAMFADDGRKYRSLYTQLGVFTEDELSSLEARGRFQPDSVYPPLAEGLPTKRSLVPGGVM